MSTERWRQANALFEEALEIAEEDRAAWLDQACGDRQALREEVDRRLRADADARADAFLAEPLVSSSEATLLSSPPSTAVPDRLGNYRIVGEIGRGGMGTVYAAERDDDAFDRQVAIKVISAGFEHDGDVAERLRAERRILARLEHPNIARVYDGGTTPDGRPYFVMEYVAGVPIDRYCADRQLSIDGRLELMLQVARAVDFAHRNLVVHRDLKPSNILVDDDGFVKLLDFGIAKVIGPEPGDSPEATAPWRQRLTLPYASPEQLRGQSISTASDVYTLGVLLFQLMTGILPRSFDGLSPWEAEQHLATTEVPRPSVAVRRAADGDSQPGVGSRRSARQLEGDLDAIVLKALRTDPEARYRSAGRLADDLELFRRGFPVDARRGTLRYRISKLVRRHRLAAALTAALAVLFLAFVGSVLISAQRLTRSQARLLEEEKKLRTTLGFLRGIFEDAGPYVAEGVPLTIRQAVDRQASRIDRAFDDRPSVQAAMLSTLGWVYLDLGEADRSLNFHQRALDLHRQQDGDSPGVAESLDGVGAAWREKWQFDRADHASATALELHRNGSETDPRSLLRSLNERVKLFCLKSDWEAADPLSAEALSIVRSQPDFVDDPEVPKAIVQRALVMNGLGHPDKARELYLASADVFIELYGPQHPILASLYNNLGGIEAEADRIDSAIELFRRADALYAAAFGDDFYDRVKSLRGLADLLRLGGKPAEAEEALRTALNVAQRSPDLGPEHEVNYFGRPAVSLAALLADQGRCPEVVALLEAKVISWSATSDSQVVTDARDLLARCGQTEKPSDTE